ncbi:glutamate racemase [Lactobacillus sp. Sy-1]|uniref:glutamate racemase n=1 Tax=Lactobacillus sp. Sy-1 TaxID=2109645 RepID=UPI001C59F51C|nr:glutamate racemase [Lactobacillus sp. Sy-1]MBW1605776.1 glutamate racemase [Lactobacillus sp. Sy-1]
MNSQPIGFMDSGVGGLTVAKEVITKLPNESIVYFGDEARLPYGEKSQAQIQTFATQIAHFLIQKQIKLLVVACNTATAQALPLLERELPIPVIGVIDPGSQLAIQTTKNNRIGVIATNGTVNSHAYDRELKRLDRDAAVFSLGCPRFIPMVEDGKYHSRSDQEVVSADVQPVFGHGIDTLILGCTHYPIMRSLIQRAVGDHIQLVDPGAAVCEQVVTTLKQTNLIAPAEHHATYQFFTTGNADKFIQIAEDWLQRKITATHVDVTELENK